MLPLLLRLVLPAHARDWTTLPPLTASPAELLAAAHAHESTGAAVLLEDVRWEVHEDGTITRRQHEVRYARSEQEAAWLATVAASWSPWFQDRPVIEARLVAADGTVTTLDPAKLTEEVDPLSDALVFTDVHALSGAFADAPGGSVIEVSIVQTEHAPFSRAAAADEWRVGNPLPTAVTRFLVDAPRGTTLTTKAEGAPSGSRVYTRRGGREVRFELRDLEPVAAPQGPPGPGSTPWPRFSWSTERDWLSLAVEYEHTAEASARAMDLASYGVTPGMDREETIRRLFAVAQGLRYVAVQFGSGSIVPATVDQTLANQFGDCKAKAILLVSLLRAAGIEASVALLRSGSGQDIQPDVPSLSGFNHAIVHIAGPTERWLDPTSPYVSADSIPKEDQGRWALVTGEEGGLVQIPTAPSTHNTVTLRRQVTLRPLGLGSLTDTREFTGLPADAARRALEGAGGKLDPAHASSGVVEGLRASGLRDVVTEGTLPPTDPVRTGFGLDRVGIAVGDWYAYDVQVDDRQLRSSLLGWGDAESAVAPDGVYLPAHSASLTWELVAPPGVTVTRPVAPVDQIAGPVHFHAGLSTPPDAAPRVVYTLDTGDGVVPATALPALADLTRAVSGPGLRLQLADPAGAEALAGRRASAAHLLQVALAATPGDALLRARFADALAALGLLDAAHAEADAAARAAPDNAQVRAWAGRAWSYGADGSVGTAPDHTRAVAELEAALRLDPSLVAARSALADLLAVSRAERPGQVEDPRRAEVVKGFAPPDPVPAPEKTDRPAPTPSAAALAAARRYPEAVAALADQSGLGVKSDRATYEALSRFEDQPVDPTNPRDLPLRVVRAAYGIDPVGSLYAKAAGRLPERGTAAWLGLQLRAADLHADAAVGAAGDRLLAGGRPSGADLQVETDAAGDVRVAWKTLPYGTLTWILVPEGGRLVIRADQDLAEVGAEALVRLARGDEASARTLLDWACASIGDDPAGGLLARPYAALVLADGPTTGPGAEATLRLAAATLLARSPTRAAEAAPLLAAGHGRTGVAGAAIATAEVTALVALDRYAAAATAADRIPTLVPMDAGLVNTVAMAWITAGRLDDAQRLLAAWTVAHPEDLDALATLAVVQLRSGDGDGFTASSTRLANVPLPERAARRLASGILWAAEADPAASRLAAHATRLLTAAAGKVPSPLLVAAALDAGQPDLAAEALAQIQTATPPWTWPSLHLDYYRGRLAEALGLPSVARELYAREPAPPPNAPPTDERVRASLRRAALESK